MEPVKARFENGTKKYQSKVIDYHNKERKSHITLRNDVKRNHKELEPLLRPDQDFLFTCLNDRIDHSLASAEIVENDVKTNFYEKVFPKVSKFENEYEEPSASTTTTDRTVEATTEVVEDTLTTESTSTSKPAKSYEETEIVIKKDNYEQDNLGSSVIIDDYSCQYGNWYSVMAMYLCGTTVIILLLLKLKRYSLLKL